MGAHDGSEAVALFELQRFDLVLLDISMPGMNGYEVMEQIFGMDGDVLIIIMTGFATVESAVKASPMYLLASDNRKERKGVYGVARDVTDRVNLEAQLRQAQKMEALGTLAGGIAHDFNNTLMGIQGYASLVKCGFDKNSEEFKRLANIDEYVSNGAEMARHLLGFAQKSCHETNRINLNYLLKMSAKMFGRTKKDIIIEQFLEKKLWSTVVDEGQIKQVLMNLFVNAWQAMSNGGKITIKSENVLIDDSRIDEFGFELAGAFVKVSVTDTGMGMDRETMSRIFDPFFTTKERGQGTGLGLATAYGIINSHKGAFKVDSTPGRGSTFMFFLPAEDARVLVSSGYSKEEQLKEMMEKGCDDFILKPFDVVMLSEKLQSVFNLMEKA